MNDRRHPLKLELIQESIRNHKKYLINELGLLYDLRESKGSHLRFGVKSRKMHNTSRFHSMRNQTIPKGENNEL